MRPSARGGAWRPRRLCGSTRPAAGSPPEGAADRATRLARMDDIAIQAIVRRLSRPHRSGGKVIERAAILASGADSRAIMSWIETHGGEAEALAAPKRGGGGLHSARLHDAGAGAATRQALRYVLPAESLVAAAAPPGG